MPTRSATELTPPRFSLLSAAREASGLLELPRLAYSLRDLRDEPRGDGAPVLVLPGFGADDRSTWAIRQYLSLQGHDVRGWGRGANVQSVPDTLERVGEIARDWADSTGRPVSLVGWSLGGYLAREAARDHPDVVERVITFGSPVIGGPKYTTVAAAASLQGWDVDEIELQVEARKQVPLRVPITAIYSRRDGVVAWPACVDPEGDAPIEHIEVDATHLGLGFNVEVYRLVARRLVAPAARSEPKQR